MPAAIFSSEVFHPSFPARNCKIRRATRQRTDTAMVITNIFIARLRRQAACRPENGPRFHARQQSSACCGAGRGIPCAPRALPSKKLESGELDAILLAASGLNRLGLSSKIKQLLPPLDFIPAVGQGALGLEVRTNDEECNKLLKFINHTETALAVRAERAFLNKLEGGCQVPIGAHAIIENGKLTVHGMVSELDGSRIIRDSLTGTCEEPEQTGETLAERLLNMGAGKILAEVYGK